MRNDVANMMKAAADTVALRVGATPVEILTIMRTEWEKAGKAQRRHIIAYLQKETAVTVH